MYNVLNMILLKLYKALLLLGADEYVHRFNARENVKIIYNACLVSFSISSGSHCVAKF